jgi:hypothetical protein
MLFNYPISAKVGRKIPKNKIYEQATINNKLNNKLNTKLKNKFVNQIEKIIWQYKLAPNTLNLNATAKVLEIQIFDIFLKNEELDEELLKVIDKAIHHPIIFQIYKNNKIKIKSAYKKSSELSNNNMLIKAYFESDWLDKNTPKQPLPQALDLEKLFNQILKSLMPIEVINNKTLKNTDERIEVINQINTLQKQLDKLHLKYDKEKQRNRQFEINQQIKIIQEQIQNLKN